MSGTPSKASNVGLDLGDHGGDGFKGADKGRNSGIETGQVFVEETHPCTPFMEKRAETMLGLDLTASTPGQHTSTTKREVNTAFTTFGASFWHNFDPSTDTSGNPGSEAFAINSGRDNDDGDGDRQHMIASKKATNQRSRERGGKIQKVKVVNPDKTTTIRHPHSPLAELASDCSAPQSEMSSDSQDGERFSVATASSPDEKYLVADHWPVDKENFTRNSAGELLKTSLIGDIEDLPRHTGILPTYRRLLGPAYGKPNQTDRAFLLTPTKVTRMKLLTTSYKTITKMINSGPREDCFEGVISLCACDTIHADVVPLIDLEDLTIVVEDILLSSVDELEDRCAQSKRAGLMSQSPAYSFTSLGVLEDKRETFHWVLCRQMGFLRPKSVHDPQTILTLCPMGFELTAATIPISFHMFRQRAAYNIRGRWYSTQAHRMKLGKILSSFLAKSEHKFIRGPDFKNSVEGFTERYHLLHVYRLVEKQHYNDTRLANCIRQSLQWTRDRCEEQFCHRIPVEMVDNEGLDSGLVLKWMTRAFILPNEDLNLLEDGWHETRDNLGRVCWVHDLFTLTKKRPMTKLDCRAVQNRRELKLKRALEGTLRPQKARKATSPKPKPAKHARYTKSPWKIHTAEKPKTISESSYEPAPDEIDKSVFTVKLIKEQDCSCPPLFQANENLMRPGAYELR